MVEIGKQWHLFSKRAILKRMFQTALELIGAVQFTASIPLLVSMRESFGNHPMSTADICSLPIAFPSTEDTL